MSDPVLELRAKQYAELCRISLDLETPLGFGQDGSVWKSSRDTAVKALTRADNYRQELACYQRFSERGITNIQGFAVPRLYHHDDQLQVIEVDIVEPPFILDFAKVWLDQPPDYPAEAVQYRDAEMKEWFGRHYPTVRKLLAALRGYGIYYVDAKPGNIMFADELPR